MRNEEQLMRDVSRALEDSRQVLRRSQALLDQSAHQRAADGDTLAAMRGELERLRRWQVQLRSTTSELEQDTASLLD